MNIRRLLLGAVLCVASAAPSRAQTRLSVGGGAGVAGSTESSLSDGHGGTVIMAQLVRGGLPFVAIGGEFNRWSHDSLNANFLTGVVQAHIPLTGFLLKVGAGYGSGDPDGLGKVSGPALQFGAAYDFTIPAAPIAITLFGNALLAHASSRSLQTVTAGLALTLR
jgi:hypothetical protein